MNHPYIQYIQRAPARRQRCITLPPAIQQAWVRLHSISGPCLHSAWDITRKVVFTLLLVFLAMILVCGFDRFLELFR